VNVPTHAPPTKRAAGPTPKGAPRLQRKCDCESAGGGTSCPACHDEQLQRRAAAEGPAGDVPGIVYETLRAPGQPLPPATRAFFEDRFGGEGAPEAALPVGGSAEGLSVSEPGDAGERAADRMAEQVLRRAEAPPPRHGTGFDFSRVRVHADARAAESARAVQARAYTVGQDIVFAGGEYAPGTSAGRELLAHELAHTTQQAGRLSRAPAGPLDRQLPQHVPKAPSMRSSAAATTPCATTGCPAKIPGSAQDFIPDGDRGEGHWQGRPSVHLAKYMAAEAPQFLQGVHQVAVLPGPEIMGKGVSWGDAQNPPADDPSAGAILVSTDIEQKAATFNQGQSPTVGGKSREEWSFNIKRQLAWAHDQIQFRRSPTPGLPAGDAGAMWELQALHGWLSAWPLEYERAMSAATPQEQDAQVQKFIDFTVENQTLGVRGILKRLRCTLSCAEVDEDITRVFGEVSSGWRREARDALLFGLMDPKRRLDWPPRPKTPQSMTFPAEPHPKMPPLYAPRTGFESEAGKSGENL
jgi:hypothetical protein